MQKNASAVIAIPSQASHKLHRMSWPYIAWLFLLAVIPLVCMICLMFVETEGVLFDEMEFSVANFSVLTEKSTLVAFVNSVKYSVITTILCIFFGYVIAYSLYQSKIKNKYLILLLLILPMWSNLLLRTNALASFFKENNIMTSLIFHMFGAEVKGMNIIGTDWAIIIGMVFTYLPFIVLPIFTSLEKIDPLLHEASLDLGATDLKKFWNVIVPLSLKGVISGSIMVFLPCFSGFAIPDILSNGNIKLIGSLIEGYFLNMSYNVGSILAVVILILILGSIFIVSKVDKEGETLI